MISTKIRHILRRMGAYDRLRESLAYDCYRFFRHGRPIRWRQNEVRFYRSLFGSLPAGALVFDVGAHRGQRTDVFLQLGARVIAIEPDPSSQRLLARRFPGGQDSGRPVTVVGKAASDASSIATMWVHAPGSGINSLSQKWVQLLGRDERRFGSTVEFAGRETVETTTLEALMVAYGVPHYIKIDVEGHEPSVLRGLGRPVPFLSFEANLPEFLPEGLEGVGILARLSGAGRFNWYSEGRGRLALAEWLPEAEFSAALKACRDDTVEIFWKNPPGAGAGPCVPAAAQAKG